MAKTILVVEDDQNISELLRLYLEKEGYHTKIAADGGQGVALFRQVRPDLIPAGKRACVCPVIGTAGIVEAMRIAADNGSVNEIVSGIQKILRNRTLRRRKRGGSFIRDQGHLYIVIQPACRAGAVQEGTKV